MAHNNCYGTDIKQGVIFMAARDMTYETFILEGDEFDEYINKWITRLNEFYE